VRLTARATSRRYRRAASEEVRSTSGSAGTHRELDVNWIPNFAYFRTNEKFLQFQWAAYAPSRNSVGASATVSDIISAINSCKASSTSVGGIFSLQACSHWNTKDAGVGLDSSAGTSSGFTAGGSGSLPGNPLPEITQIQQWIGRGAWVALPTGQNALLSVLSGTQPIPQTLYADEAVYGSFLIAAAPTSVSHTSLPANIPVSVTLSGGPDNYFHAGDSDGPGYAESGPYESVHQLNVTLACFTSTGLSCSLGTTLATLTAGSPTASTTLTITGTVAGTVYVLASEANWPSVTVGIAVT